MTRRSDYVIASPSMPQDRLREAISRLQLQAAVEIASSLRSSQ